MSDEKKKLVGDLLFIAAMISLFLFINQGGEEAKINVSWGQLIYHSLYGVSALFLMFMEKIGREMLGE